MPPFFTEMAKHTKREESSKDAMERQKKDFLKAYEACLGNISKACSSIKISRMTFYNWKNNDQEFASKIENVDESLVDFAETMLLKSIRNENLTAIIFYLKTKGKKRGYVEQQEVKHGIGSFESFLKDLPDDPE